MSDDDAFSHDTGAFSAAAIRSSGVRSVRSTYSVDENVTTILADSGPGGESIDVLLPEIGDAETSKRMLGYQATIKKVAGSGSVLVKPSVGAAIDGHAAVSLDAVFDWVTVLWGPEDTPRWNIIGKGP